MLRMMIFYLLLVLIKICGHWRVILRSWLIWTRFAKIILWLLLLIISRYWTIISNIIHNIRIGSSLPGTIKFIIKYLIFCKLLLTKLALFNQFSYSWQFYFRYLLIIYLLLLVINLLLITFYTILNILLLLHL